VTSSKPKRLLTWLLVALVALGVLGLAWRALDRRLVCASIFLRLERSEQPAWLVHYRERPVDVRSYVFAGGRGQLYSARGVSRAPGVVLAHGMHEEGIVEPRLIGLARALAGAGYAVLTPEVPGLARYQITHSDVDGIAAAARALAREQREAQVIVFGISFGGGLALRAACEPANRAAIARVIALGAHNDAARVSRFYLGEPALGPMAERALVEPHPYGRVALWMSLFGERHKGEFSEAERVTALKGVLARTAELSRASPSSCPSAIQIPLFLVHGTGDRVVPYTETLWNEHQLGQQTTVETLISPAIVHAEYAPPSWWERLQLIEFIVDALY
jgi:alpha-beta hydrolase superfamily lysophospholipase